MQPKGHPGHDVLHPDAHPRGLRGGTHAGPTPRDPPESSACLWEPSGTYGSCYLAAKFQSRAASATPETLASSQQVRSSRASVERGDLQPRFLRRDPPPTPDGHHGMCCGTCRI